MTGSAPLIAVHGELAVEDGKPRLSLAVRYLDAVRRAGGVPFALPPLCDGPTLAALLERADGLLLTGGDDFTTESLGLGPTHPRAKPVPETKQAADLELARAALDAGLPVLGICYGMQLLALAEGARLFQHLPDEVPGVREHAGGVRHDVGVQAETKLSRLLGVTSLPVISRHHQALSAVEPPWVVAARDDQGLIEATERTEHPFAVGVQWHPELAAPGGPEDGLFAGLVEAAGRHAALRRVRTEATVR